jgi:hypothetical protein
MERIHDTFGGTRDRQQITVLGVFHPAKPHSSREAKARNANVTPKHWHQPAVLNGLRGISNRNPKLLLCCHILDTCQGHGIPLPT